MAKTDLGTKRVCPETGRKFYDLNKTPVISPYTGKVVPIAPVARARPETAAAKPVAEKAEVAEPETADVELVSLEDADAEAQGSKKNKAAANADVDTDDDDVEIEDNMDDDNDAFIEEEEEGDADVSDIIGDGIEKEEES